MMEPIGPHNLPEYAAALAEGELDAEAINALTRFMAEHPESAQLIQDQQRLALVAKRVTTNDSSGAPDELRRRIVLRSKAEVSARWIHQPGLRWKAAIAAVIVLALGLSILKLIGHSTESPTGWKTSASVVPASIVAQASQVHADCSRLARGLHSAGYPAEQAELAQSVEHDLHSKEPWPDLSSIGFTYEGAGPCAQPLTDTLHLLYRSKRPGSRQTVSVFVQLYHGQMPIDLGRVYTVSVAQSPFPMLAWRTDRVIYFLLADDEQTEQNALNAIGSAPQKSGV